MLTGTFVCAGIPGSPFMVHRGDFQLFSSDNQVTGAKNIIYDFDMTSTTGEKFNFHGYKIVDSSVTLDPVAFWKATSTLYVTIRKLNGTIIGRGILRMAPKDFLSETFTLTATGRNMLAKLHSTISFLSYFVKQGASLFFTPFTSIQYPLHTFRGYINPTPISQTIEVIASDGVKTNMQMWEACPSDPSLDIIDLFMIPGASVDHQIFSLQTIPQNAVQYFTRAGYRVWVITHRIGRTMQAENNWTTFDARLDLKAALQYIRSTQSPPQKIYTIAHCMGSVAFACGLLDGTIPTAWIKGVSCSQVFMNPTCSLGNYAKLLSPVPINSLYKLISGNWFSCSSSEEDGLVQRGINQVLRLYPDERKELCTNVSCHRCSFVFGR
jgi:hypothetical protein